MVGKRCMQAAPLNRTTWGAAASPGFRMSDDSSTVLKQKPGLGDALRRYTPARVSLGQAGPAIPTSEQLRFQLDHALARDAVHARLDLAALLQELRGRQMGCLAVRGAGCGADGQE